MVSETNSVRLALGKASDTSGHDKPVTPEAKSKIDEHVQAGIGVQPFGPYDDVSLSYVLRQIERHDRWTSSGGFMRFWHGTEKFTEWSFWHPRMGLSVGLEGSVHLGDREKFEVIIGGSFGYDVLRWAYIAVAGMFWGGQRGAESGGGEALFGGLFTGALCALGGSVLMGELAASVTFRIMDAVDLRGELSMSIYDMYSTLRSSRELTALTFLNPRFSVEFSF